MVTWFADGFAMEAYDWETKRRRSQVFVKTDLSTTRRMLGWNEAKDLAWEPRRRLFLFLFLGVPDSHDGSCLLRLWAMPEGDVVGMRKWVGSRPVSVVFGQPPFCYVGTESGQIFCLRVPDLRTERQMA